MKKALAVITAMTVWLTGCGGGDSATYKNSALVNTWQTYSASPVGGIHYWSDETNKYEYTVQKLARIDSTFRSGFAFVSNGDLIFHNLATREQYKLESNGSYTRQEDRIYLNAYKTESHYFTYDEDTVFACRFGRDTCTRIDIEFGTYPYVYAESHGKVLIVTNWGDALVFNGFTWCRMSRDSADVFKCDPTEPKATRPRAIQFYSSIVYRGRTLLGEWPSGSIYEFDGETLAPSAYWTPPQFLPRTRLGYEAQTMAEYCGDLFLGFWPRGDIWRFDGKRSTWNYFKRLFTDTTPEQFIPYFSREPDNLNSAFFGQRVTALVPYQDGLYATTSSLTVWSPDIRPTFLNSDQLDEYGSIYKIYREGCQTVYDKFDDYGA